MLVIGRYILFYISNCCDCLIIEYVCDTLVVSMDGSNELVRCFCWGAVAEGGSGAVVQFIGDGVEVELVAGDGGSLGQAAADEPVLVFVVPLTQGW